MKRSRSNFKSPFLATFTNPQMIQQFKDHYESICDNENKLAISYDMVDNYECNSVDDLDKEYEKFQREVAASLPNQKDTASYKDFCAKIDSVAVNALLQVAPSQMNILDDDIQVEEQNPLEMIDPLTKQLIKNPVRNIFCNHVYEETSILEAIKSKVRCPYMGCSNKQVLKNTHLKLDEQLRNIINEAQNQQEQMEQFPIYESDSD